MENHVEQPLPNQNVIEQPKKKKSPWLWIIGGCLGVCLLIFITLVILGWMAARKIKNEINEFSPQVDQFKESVEKVGNIQEQAEAMSQEFQNNLSELEKSQTQIPQ